MSAHVASQDRAGRRVRSDKGQRKRPDKWTDERIAHIREAWTKGVPARQLLAELNAMPGAPITDYRGISAYACAVLGLTGTSANQNTRDSDTWRESRSIRSLRMLWKHGHSVSEIGRRLGITRNAVIGKAHRLGLPPRPSPIRRPAP